MEVLVFASENESQFPLTPKDFYDEYTDETDYESSQSAFSQLTQKLQDKGCLEKRNGSWEVTDRGQDVARNIANESVITDEPEGYDQVKEQLEDFLTHEYDSDDIHGAIAKGDEFTVSLSDLDKFHPELFEGFLQENPRSFFRAFNEVLEDVCEPDEAPSYGFETDVEWLKRDLPEALNSSNIDKPVIVRGMIRSSDTEPAQIDYSAVFKCTQCFEYVEKDQDSGGDLKSPYKCDMCGSNTFDVEERKTKDVMDLELSHQESQEATLNARVTGNPDIPQTRQRDLRTGSEIKALGVVELEDRGKQEKMNSRLDVLDFQRVDKMRDISKVESGTRDDVRKKVRLSENPLEKFAQSLAPRLGDLELAKKCAAVSLVGAPDVGQTDGRIHSLIVSNPGTGKSDLQGWLNDHFDRTHRADGANSTGVGLTASAEQQDGGRWQLVAGPLVFADKGYLQIDEFDKFNEGDLAQLNTAMEEGVFSVTKASINANLPGRATVIATGNFSKRLDTYESAYEKLPVTREGFYDRFALMCGINQVGKDSEKKISYRFLDDDSQDSYAELFDAPFTPEELRVYRHLARQKDPMLTQEASDRISEFKDAAQDKTQSRFHGSSNRFLVHLNQLTMAVARFRLKDKATEEDALEALKLKRQCRESLDLQMGEDASTKIEMSRVKNDVEQALKDCGADSGPVSMEDIVIRVDSDPASVESILNNMASDGVLMKHRKGWLLT